MKKILVLLCLLFCTGFSLVSAEQKEEPQKIDYKEQYEEARFFYATANACLAAYDDRVGNIFYTFMQHDGWHAERFKKTGELADVNIFLAKRFDPQSGKNTYILSFRGTASKKDVRLDKRTGRVLFAGSSLEEIKKNAERLDVPDTFPKVHKGFLQYTLAALSADLENEDLVPDSDRLYDVIKEDANSELIITGHSLGGAAAVLYAASIVNMGVPSERVKVVTFGAPAVGNKEFAEIYQDKINVTRIYSSFDPVPGGLQSFYSYVQFGKPFVVRSDPRVRVMQHNMENYADLMGKYYYSCKDEAIEHGVIPKDPVSYDEGSGKIVAVAVIQPVGEYRLVDYKYARENLLDAYRWSFFRYRILDIADRKVSKLELEDMARKIGADYLLTARVGISRVRVTKEWIIALDQALFTTDGTLVSGLTHSVKIKEGGSFFQASAYNGFKAVESLHDLDVGLVRPLDYLVSE